MASSPIFFWGHTKGDYAFLSNFFPSRFVDESGVVYNCSEQFFMKKKQEAFDPGNEAVAQIILASRSPVVVKAAGRKVRNFDEKIWGEVRFGVMKQALLLKFAQNPGILRGLLNTGDAILVEASPCDRVWGIGLSSAQAEKRDPTQWPGLNLLGKALMEVRSDLRK